MGGIRGFPSFDFQTQVWVALGQRSVVDGCRCRLRCQWQEPAPWQGTRGTLAPCRFSPVQIVSLSARAWVCAGMMSVKNHILPAGLFDLPRRNQPPGIGQQHYFQEDLGIVSGPPGLIITVLAIKNG